jgi:hypothetical protein
MTKKHVRDISLIIIAVFIITIIVYPLIFGTDKEPKNGPPVELELNK